MNPKLKLAFLLLAGIVVLAGAVYLAMIYIFPNINASGGHSGGVSIRQIPAPGLPVQEADLQGVVSSVVDNSIFVAPVKSIQVSPLNGGKQPTPAGPYSEVLISKGTKIWLDVTDNDAARPAAGSSGASLEVQQKLESSDIAAIANGSNVFVEVWGQKRGDRLNADVIVVSHP
jgi:hypothetical protein